MTGGRVHYPKINITPHKPSPREFKPWRWITLTYPRHKAISWDHMATQVWRFLLDYAQLTRCHIVANVGITSGINAHVHLIIYRHVHDKPKASLMVKLATFGVAGEIWTRGRTLDEAYRSGHATHGYTCDKHRWLPMGGNIFCPGKRHACRGNRCIKHHGKRQKRNRHHRRV